MAIHNSVMLAGYGCREFSERNYMMSPTKLNMEFKFGQCQGQWSNWKLAKCSWNQYNSELHYLAGTNHHYWGNMAIM